MAVRVLRLVLQQAQLVALDDKADHFTGGVSSRVDVYSVPMEVRLRYRRVAVDDQLLIFFIAS